MSTATQAKIKLKSLATREVAASSARFFKCGPGEYAEGDIFIGVRMPTLRIVAREFRELALPELESLVNSSFHEERMLALLILVQSVARCSDDHRKTVFDFYMGNTRHVNNWDLVDTSSPAIVGGYLTDKSRKPLVKLAKSASLWERRIAIVATQYFIRLGDFADTLTLSRQLLRDKEDLIHKASGWMLREVGERDEQVLLGFLDQHAFEMPRTMLRYAIEHLVPDQRKAYMAEKGLKPRSS